MKRAVSAEQMRICDYNAINSGILSLNLMENAANAVCEEFINIYKGGKIAIICGGGNNGGDGAAAARLLYKKGILSDVYFFYSHLSDDCKTNYNALKKLSLNIYDNLPQFDFCGYDYIIDALFGTGLNRQVEGLYKNVIEKINNSGAVVLSIDISSGLFDGEIKTAVKSCYTVSLAAYKYCQLFSGLDYSGKIVVRDINIPIDCGAYVYQNEDIKKFFPNRKIDSHKGSYGKLSIIAGSGKYFGAALISYNGAAALKTGGGLVTLAIPRFLADNYRNYIKESVLEYLPDNGENTIFDNDVITKIINNSDAICIGMGMGNNTDTYEICVKILNTYKKRLLLDADALNSIAEYGKDVLKNKTCEVIITPHIKEFSRLSGLTVEEIKQNSLQAARDFAKEYNLTVLLKGATTIITDGFTDTLNLTGSPAMAKAGSGDVLSGIIGGIMAQGHSAYLSGVVGAYIHGRAGEIAEQRLGEYSVLASDICDNISSAIMSL